MLELTQLQIEVQLIGPAHGAGDDVLGAVMACGGRIEDALIDHRLHLAVIVRDAAQRVAAESIHAAVAGPHAQTVASEGEERCDRAAAHAATPNPTLPCTTRR